MGIETALLAAGAASAAYSAKKDRDVAKDNADLSMEQRDESQAFIERMMEQTRGDLFKLYPSIQDSQQKGLQAGLDIYKQAFPVQLNAFRQGNVGAQQHMINAQPQMQNAILGRPTNYAPQATTIDAGVGGLRMPTAPQFQPVAGLGLQGGATQQTQLTPEQIQTLLAQFGGMQ